MHQAVIKTQESYVKVNHWMSLLSVNQANTNFIKLSLLEVQTIH